MAYKRICKICGRQFETLDYRVRYCSDDCREIGTAISKRRKQGAWSEQERQRKAERRMAERAEKVRQSAAALASDDMAARDMGMTYGQYKAYMKEKEEKINVRYILYREGL